MYSNKEDRTAVVAASRADSRLRSALILVDDLIDSRLLVARSSYNIFIVSRNVTAQYRRRFLRLEY